MTTLERTDIEDGKRIVDIFATLSEENKNMAIVYLSALRDKEMQILIRHRKKVHKFLELRLPERKGAD